MCATKTLFSRAFKAIELTGQQSSCLAADVAGSHSGFVVPVKA